MKIYFHQKQCIPFGNAHMSIEIIIVSPNENKQKTTKRYDQKQKQKRQK